MNGPIEAGSGLDRLTQAVMSHRQEEQIEGVRLASARSRAPLQNIDCFGVPTDTVQRDAHGIPIERLIGCQRDGLAGEYQRSLRVAPGEGAARRDPGIFVQGSIRILGQATSAPAPIEPRFARLAESVVCSAAELEEREVVRA